MSGQGTLTKSDERRFAGLDETTRELLVTALRLHDPEFLRAFDDHAENRPVPDVDRVGNARRAA